jgi:hypothetical protein
MIAKLKSPYVDRLNRPYATGDDKKRKMAEAFEALNAFVRKHGGTTTSPPGKTLRIEVAKDSAAKLISKLTELGYNIAHCGFSTRIVGAAPSDPKTERRTRVVPSPFLEVCVLEIRTDGW